MYKASIWAVIVVAASVLSSERTFAGLTVSLTVDNEAINLLPMYPNSGTPDSNNQFQDGFVAVAGGGFDIDHDSQIDLFIDALYLTSEKSSTEGKVTTINISTRLMGSKVVNAVLTAYDDFGLPATGVNTPLLITSAFEYVDLGSNRPVTLTSALDGIAASPLTVGSPADIPGTKSQVMFTQGTSPFQLKSTFNFSIAPNSTVAFMAESIASGVRVATVPELTSLAAWACLVGFGGAFCFVRKRLVRVR
jgi:hypothetical protein